jgi:hypothetical protein
MPGGTGFLIPVVLQPEHHDTRIESRAAIFAKS